ncbi:hypothetical protein PCNPT3_05545 [Psychromonas sp. CNPT3]|uniref:alanine/ornithine racemase family PLP-dependent enzyme n=1 Tax=Psychromonas sp. CNPT3 TaxID=314282 RepID=UPI00006E3C16|nr:alanine/ornithine racemase family PLP-dependent enzyme [Psychromonas sp. CNPT3]AGH81051.1 hypothetical protein PCNPT3_05545 [Psychromonas sp. CNPT3]
MHKSPCINIDLGIIKSNTQSLIKECKKHGVIPCGIAKLACAEPKVEQALIDAGIHLIADPRIVNLKKIKHLNCIKMLLRMPSLSEIEDVITYSDISLNTEIVTLKALSVAAIKQHKIHKIIIMHDLGDLREGAFYEQETLTLAEQCMQLKGLELVGLGSNLACYGGVEPTFENQTQLLQIAKKIENKNAIKLTYISGASSAALPLMLSGKLPKGINQLRLGASLLMGIGLNDDVIPNTQQDAFTLSAEIIEIKIKPSVPLNSTAKDAFGHKPVFVDRGNRKRAICALGKQDIDFSQLFLKDKNIMLIGGSSDHLILDITDVEPALQIGDSVDFTLSYSGILQCMTSEYVHKNFC